MKNSILDSFSKIRLTYSNASIKSKLNIALNTALLIPLTASFIYAVIFFGNKIKEEALLKNESDLNLASFFYDNKLKEYEKAVGNFSNDGALGLLLTLNLKKQINESLQERLKGVDYDMVHVLDKTSNVITRVHNSNLLNDKLEKDFYFNSALNNKINSGTVILKRIFLKREGKENTINENDEYGISIKASAPIYNKITGKIVGVVVISKILNNYQTFLSQMKNQIGEDVFIYQGNKLAIASNLSKDGTLAPNIISELVQNKKYQQANILSEFISGFTPIVNSENKIIGSLAVKVPTLDFKLTFIYGFISFLLIGVLGFLLAMKIRKLLLRYILSPINLLNKGTQILAKGNYDHIIAVQNKDEIGELSTAFNTMAKDLKTSYEKLEEYNSQLEKKVEERTKELVKKNEQLEVTLEMLNPGVSKLIAKNEQKEGLIEGTEFVNDICGYTRLNMLLSEEFVGNLMNQYYQESHKILAKYRGFRDKTVGDQTVACFGIPKDDFKRSEFHSFDAVVSAMEINKLIDAMDADLKIYIKGNKTVLLKKLEKLKENASNIDEIFFQARTGLNTSILNTDKDVDQMRMVMMGGITGSDYTGQGGALICAARLEAQGVGRRIHLGENTVNIIKDFFNVEELESVHLKGLGTQKRYNLLGSRYFFDNFDKKSKIKSYQKNIPILIYKILNDVSVATISIKEVSKISKNLPVSVRYLEHCCGKYNEILSRSIMLYILGSELKMNPKILENLIIGYTIAKVNILIPSDFVMKREANLIETYINSGIKIHDVSYVNKIVEKLKTPEISTDNDVKLACLVDSYDVNFFDRNFLQKNKESLYTNYNQFTQKFSNNFSKTHLETLSRII